MRTSLRLVAASAATVGLMAIGAPAFASGYDGYGHGYKDYGHGQYEKDYDKNYYNNGDDFGDGINLLNDNNVSVLPVQLCGNDVAVIGAVVPILSPSETQCVNAPIVEAD